MPHEIVRCSARGLSQANIAPGAPESNPVQSVRAPTQNPIAIDKLESSPANSIDSIENSKPVASPNDTSSLGQRQRYLPAFSRILSTSYARRLRLKARLHRLRKREKIFLRICKRILRRFHTFRVILVQNIYVSGENPVVQTIARYFQVLPRVPHISYWWSIDKERPYAVTDDMQTVSTLFLDAGPLDVEGDKERVKAAREKEAAASSKDRTLNPRLTEVDLFQPDSQGGMDFSGGALD